MIRTIRFAPRSLMAAFAVLIAACGGTAPAPAPAPTPTVVVESQPQAKDIVARYEQAVGGYAALMNHPVTRMKGTFEMPAMGVKGPLEIVVAREGLVIMTVDIPGMGQLLTGYDGAHGWSVNPMQGARLLTGSELDELKRQGNPSAELRRMENFTSATIVEKTKLNGQDCYKVAFVWKTGRESWDCFAVETGLIVASGNKQEGPMGTMDILTLTSDYKDFGGIKVATRMAQEAMGQTQVFTINTVTYEPLDRAVFAPPAAIQALVAQQKK
jgi:hypothetical protein